VALFSIEILVDMLAALGVTGRLELCTNRAAASVRQTVNSHFIHRALTDSAAMQRPTPANERVVASPVHPRSTVGLLAVAGLMCLIPFRHMPLRLNLSSSIPPGWYLARGIGAGRPVRRGALVAACLPIVVAGWGRARGYLHRGRCPGGTAPVGKPVFAIGGDTITVGPFGLELNSNPALRTKALRQDSDGRPLPRVPDGRYVVQPGEVWLVSTYSPRSWDSRYYGPVPVSAIISALRPVWIFSVHRP
jgi:conjugative transfer signal peptidase TraF